MQQKLQAFTDHSWRIPCLIILLYFVMFTISFVGQSGECGKEVLKTENVNYHHVKYHSDQKSAGRCMPRAILKIIIINALFSAHVWPV